MAADQGNPIAQRHMGELHQNGWGVSKDYAEAMRWYRMAADQGDAVAQTHIGVVYRNGQGAAQDYAEAMRWAQRDIGFLYQNGPGVTKDYADAMRWYRLAADKGEAVAQRDIGFLYQNGLGVTKDYARRCAGTAWPPIRAKPRRKTTSRPCITTARARPRTMPRRCAGIVRPLTREMPRRKTTSGPCITTARAWRVTRASPPMVGQGGSRRQRYREEKPGPARWLTHRGARSASGVSCVVAACFGDRPPPPTEPSAFSLVRAAMGQRRPPRGTERASVSGRFETLPAAMNDGFSR
jgi:hypothetical protein